MIIRDTSNPVVVLKAEHYGTLGIMRSLGREGIQVFAVDPAATAPAFASRYCSGKFLWDIEGAPPASSVELISRIVIEIGRRPVLLPTSDETAQFVAENADALDELCIFSHQRADLVNALCSKKEMYHLALSHNIPVPATFFPSSRREVAEIGGAARYPLALKGIRGARLERRSGRKMVLVHTKHELLRIYDALEDPENPNLMIQEYILGPEDSSWMFNGYFDETGRCLTSFTGRKIRQNPIHCGMTSLGICARNNTVAGISTHFLGTVGYRGIVDIDFRFDARDGLYKMLDVNPRTGATFRLFVGRNGLDVVKAAYLDLTGQAVPPEEDHEGRKWIVEDKDILSSYRYLREGKLTLSSWVRSLGKIDEAGYFSKEDLRPFWRLWWNHLRRRISKLLRVLHHAHISGDNRKARYDRFPSGKDTRGPEKRGKMHTDPIMQSLKGNYEEHT